MEWHGSFRLHSIAGIAAMCPSLAGAGRELPVEGDRWHHRTASGDRTMVSSSFNSGTERQQQVKASWKAGKLGSWEAGSEGR